MADTLLQLFPKLIWLAPQFCFSGEEPSRNGQLKEYNFFFNPAFNRNDYILVISEWEETGMPLTTLTISFEIKIVIKKKEAVCAKPSSCYSKDWF